MSNSLIGNLARFTALVLLATLLFGVAGFVVHGTYNRILVGVAGGLVRIVEPKGDDTRMRAVAGGIEVEPAYPGAGRFAVDSLQMHLSTPLILALLLVGGPGRRSLVQRGQRVLLGLLLVFAGHTAALIAQVEFSSLDATAFRGAVYYIARFCWWVGTVWALLVMPAGAALYVYWADWRHRPEASPRAGVSWTVFAGVAAVLVVWSVMLTHLRPALPPPAAPVPASRDGRAVFEAGEYAEAAAIFRRRLQQEPGNATLRFDLGVSLYRLGAFAEAVVQFEEAEGLQPDHPHLDITLGAALFDLGRREEALERFRQADLDRETDVTLLLQVGGALVAGQDLVGAEAAYRRTLEVAPQDSTAHYRLGTVVMALGRGEEAVVSFEQALGLRPDFVEAWKYLALAQQNAGRLDRAATAYHRALEVDPHDVAALAGLGTLLTRSQDPCMGLEFLERCAAVPGASEQKEACRDLAGQLAASCNS